MTDFLKPVDQIWTSVYVLTSSIHLWYDLQEDEPRPALNPHIQDIQLVHLKIGDHMVVFQAIEG